MSIVQTISSLLEQKTEQCASKWALNFNDERLTYAELNAKANQFAHYIMGIRSPSCSFIPLFLDKSIDAVISLFAVLKAGLAYIPINTEATDSMIEAIFLDSNANCIITQSKYIHRLVKYSKKLIQFDLLKDELADFSKKNLVIKPNFFDAAYVIYTSGTTGLPKGVLVTHDNLVQTYNSWEKIYDLNTHDIHLQMANFAFDVFAGDYLRALGSGAELVLCPKETLLQPKHLIQLIHKKQINCAEFIPAVLRNLLSYLKDNKITLDQFRLLVCGSDVWTMAEFRDAKKKFPNARVINSYGLTEATIDSTYFEEDTIVLENTEIVPVGKPFPHVSVYIFDEMLKPLNNEVGEIYIGGKGVAKGYLNKEELTRERFITHPETQDMLYRTGDFGKQLKNGNVEFLGRNQFHIKIHGNRVELLTLEKILNQYPKIKCAIACVLNSSPKNQLGYFILPSDETIHYEEIILHVKQHLPHYYLPNFIYLIEEVVLTQNGKLERSYASQKIKHKLKPASRVFQNELEEKIHAIWRRQLGIKDIEVTQTFYELGVSSLLFASVIEELNKVFNINLDFCNVSQTIQDLSQQINCSLNNSLNQELTIWTK